MENARQSRAHLISSTAGAMIAESDVTTDPGARRLASRLLRQGSMFERLSRSPRTETTVHRLRVLSRRMRAACTVGRRLAPADAVRELARRLRRLGRALGERRALDVAAADYAALSGGRTHPAIEAARAAAGAKLTRRLRARHRDTIIAAVRDAVDALRTAEPEPGALERLLRIRGERVRESLGATGKTELHRLRIEAKKLRYALETARVMGHRTSRAGETALKRLQRRLGRIHDLETLRHLLPPQDPMAIRAAAREAALRAGVQAYSSSLRTFSPFARGGNGRAP
jgi:CHAD domain-containing protein